MFTHQCDMASKRELLEATRTKIQLFRRNSLTLSSHRVTHTSLDLIVEFLKSDYVYMLSNNMCVHFHECAYVYMYVCVGAQQISISSRCLGNVGLSRAFCLQLRSRSNTPQSHTKWWAPKAGRFVFLNIYKIIFR